MAPYDWAGAPGGALLLFFALIADAALPGGAALGRLLPHPRRLVASITLELDRRLNRDKRSDRARVFRGALIVLVLAGAAATLGWLVEEAGRGVAYGWIAEFLVLTVMISQRGTFRQGREAPADHHREAPADHHREAPADDHRPAREAIEAVAGRFAARVVAPVFWYALLGLPGVATHAAVNAMAGVIGGPGRRQAAFGLAAGRLDDVLTAIPARLAALLFVVAALFAPGASPAGALRVAWRDSGKHPSFSAGWPLAAVAGALDLALAGPDAQTGRKTDWIGSGRARATASDVSRVLYLFVVACLLVAAVAAGAVILSLTS